MTLSILLAVAAALVQPSADTLIHKEESRAGKSERNMMLNAESANVPREINVGLPDSGNGAVVFMNGTKHAYGLPKSYMHWSGGNSFERTGSISLMESVISTGEIGVLVDSYTRLGGDRIRVIATAGTSTNGLIKVDANVSGPLARGWYFSAGAYVNMDPTNVNAPCRTFVNQQQNYNASVSKRWASKASVDLIYQFSIGRTNFGNGFSVAPFVYAGDGSVSQYGNFRIGRDGYFPGDDAVTWIDIKTGEQRSGNIGNMESYKIHDISLSGKYNTESGWKLSAIGHLCLVQPSTILKHSLSGIDDFSGTPGQSRLLTVYDTRTADLELRFKAERQFSRHLLKLGFYYIHANQYEAGSSFRYAHTVTPDPERLMRGTARTWDFNKSGSYLDAIQNSAVLYGFDDWTPTDRLLLRLGLRFRFVHFNVNNAARIKEDEGTDFNRRIDGFNLADTSISKIHNIVTPGVDGAVTLHANYRIVGRLFGVAEGFYSLTNKTTTYYKNATIPSLKAIGNALARGGLMYDNNWMDCTAMFSYITSWNNASAVDVTKVIGGKSETQLYTAQNGIGTPGVTVDGNVHFGGFNMHALATWQDPRYHNYDCHFEFSDGSTQDISYTGNHVTGISQWMVELDPSYKWEHVRIWLSARYFSKQYASRSNLAWFNGHWETFAGVDYNINSHHKLSLDAVNLLCQNGAKGSMDVADTIDDASLLNNRLMSGTYIRPFCVNLGYTFNF